MLIETTKSIFMLKKVLIVILFFIVKNVYSQGVDKQFHIDKDYINYPIQSDAKRQKMFLVSGDDTLFCSDIRIAENRTDYWVFTDVSVYKGQSLTLVFEKNSSGINEIYLSEKINGADSLYSETNRPQFHFTSRRGWNNDPNGLVYLNGEYHLYYQHNPYERNWGNMHWGHAVSKDLIHWEELNDALFPDKLGTMFSGSAIIDKNNTSGWGENVLVAAYTAAGEKQTQCIAYSIDNGRTFKKYDGNPVIDSKEKWNDNNTRDPKVFWYEKNKEWVMVLFEAYGHSIYTSTNLKEWKYESFVKGFWECPELFELPVDGNKDNTKWVLYGASGTYMIGSFDGREFIPEGGKYRTTFGNQYAAQTYNNIPDGRRIQIGWGTIEQNGMPFNQMMMFPTELSLSTTNEGVRLYSKPVEEVNKLYQKEYSWENLTLKEANEKLKEVKSDLLHIKLKVKIPRGIWYNLNFKGNKIVTFEGNYDLMNKYQYIQDFPGKYDFEVEVLIDRTSVEVYFDNGKMVTVSPFQEPKSNEGLVLKAAHNELIIHSLKVYELNSIWNNY